MSAWLCENKTLSLCVDVIKSDDFKLYDVGNYGEKTEEELIQILTDLNTKSLNARYGESEYNVLKNPKYINLNVDDGQKHKSVACYTYQTCEAEYCREHPLFQSLEEWERANQQHEDYWDLYEWDIDNPIGVE